AVAAPRRQASDHRPDLRIGGCRLAGGGWGGLGGVFCRRLEPRPRLDLCLGLSRTGLGDRVGPGGGAGFGIGAATGLGPRLGERCDHCGHGPLFEAGWRLDVRGKALDYPADLAVLLDDALAVTATGEMAVELGPPGRDKVAEYEVEGLGMGQLDISLRQ